MQDIEYQLILLYFHHKGARYMDNLEGCEIFVVELLIGIGERPGYIYSKKIRPNITLHFLKVKNKEGEIVEVVMNGLVPQIPETSDAQELSNAWKIQQQFLSEFDDAIVFILESPKYEENPLRINGVNRVLTADSARRIANTMRELKESPPPGIF